MSKIVLPLFLCYRCNFTSKTLLNLFMNEFKLKKCLTEVKHLFLMDQGDFFTLFMDKAEQELKRDVGFISLPRITALLHIALRSSSLANTELGDNFSAVFLPYSLTEQLEMIIKRGQETHVS